MIFRFVFLKSVIFFVDPTMCTPAPVSIIVFLLVGRGVGNCFIADSIAVMLLHGLLLHFCCCGNSDSVLEREFISELTGCPLLPAYPRCP